MTRRTIARTLASAPGLFLRLLQCAGRGEADKRLFLRLVRRGDIVCDVGANLGRYTLLFSDLVRASGMVHAFEPVPPTMAKLRANLERDAGWPNWTLYPVALSGESGEANILVPDSDHGQASLKPHSVGSWERPSGIESFTVPVKTLDEIAGAWTRLDFLKCDVEGAELPVLRGARKTLERLSPVVFVEAYRDWTRDFDYEPMALVQLLREAGYRGFWFIHGLTCAPLHENDGFEDPANILASKEPHRFDGLRI